MPQLDEDHGNTSIFQQDGAPSHLHHNVTQFLNNHLPWRWIGIGQPTIWPPRSQI